MRMMHERKHRAPRPVARGLLLGLLTAATLTGSALTGASAQQIEIANPDLFKKSLNAARQAAEQFELYDDPAALRRIADIGYQLALESGYRQVPFSFYLIDMPVPNAFALPGGQIFVTRGMLELGLTDAMLANLLGHEIAHVTRRHGIRMQKRATLLNILSQALVLGVLVGVDDSQQPARDGTIRSGDSRRGSMVQGAMAGSLALSELLLRDHSRDFEDEADEDGQRLAAGGGYDPHGAQHLWQLMSARLPQSNQYGYWRTHPFSNDRQRAAMARAEDMKIQDPKPVDDYRAQTQQVLLAWSAEVSGKDADLLSRFAEDSALTAWPKGSRAESLRLAELRRTKALAVDDKPAVARDYGAVVRAYLRAIEEVRTVDPETAFVRKLERDIADLREASTAIQPEAVAVWEGGVWETGFLEVFLSNFPTVKEAPAVALALGNAYARLGRPGDATVQYLRAVESGPETDEGASALRGLRNLVPRLESMAALQRIADQLDDAEISARAGARLEELARGFDEVATGAAYLAAYPDGAYTEVVNARLEVLAENLYGEVLLFQSVGDLVQALDRINLILTHAPLSRAAAHIREKAVFETS